MYPLLWQLYALSQHDRLQLGNKIIQIRKKPLIQQIELFLLPDKSFYNAKFACFDVTYPNHWVCKGSTYSAVIFLCSAAL